MKKKEKDYRKIDDGEERPIHSAPNHSENKKRKKSNKLAILAVIAIVVLTVLIILLWN